jgi:hydroxyacyl-ACP dehydratase HTD2-like protein with hotdog domain
MQLVLLCELIRIKVCEGTSDVVLRVEYRNLAPLYAGEELKLCARDRGNKIWEVWAEGPDGGIAIRGEIEIGAPAER